MRRIFKALVAAVGFAALFSGSPAQAGIPIPCTGEAIVKVLDLPRVDAARSPEDLQNTKHFDLGYKFNGCWGGEWVGYTGNSATYLALPQDLLRLMVITTGRADFPVPPSFMGTFSASWVVWLYLAIFGWAILHTVFFAKVQGVAAEKDAVPQPLPAAPMPAAPREPVTPAVAAPRRTPRMAASAPGTATFGRRG